MKTNPYLRALLALVVIPFLCEAQTPQKWVTVYTDNFSGYHYDLEPGRYDNTYLIQSGLSNIGSIKIPEGMKVVLYAEDDFRGNNLVLTEDVLTRYLEGKGFKDVRLSISMVVEQLPAGTPAVKEPFVTIFRDSFSGPSKKLAPGYYDHFEFGHIENDQVSSIQVPKGLQVTLYEHGGFGGRKLLIKEDAPADFLVKNNFNDATSSIRVELLPVKAKDTVTQATPEEKTVPPAKAIPADVPIKGPFVTIFQDDYAGPSKKLVPGRYTVESLGIADNELSSIRIPKELRVILYDVEDFSGRSLELNQDASRSRLQSKHFDDLTSSIIVEVVPRVTVFADNMAGNSISFDPGFYNTEDLKIGNDQLSSVAVPPGMWVLLFDDMAFKGRSLLLTQDANKDVFLRNQFDNKSSSLVVGDSEWPLPQVEIFADDFGGRSKKLTPGNYEAHELGIGNDALSSVKVPRGMRVTLFESEGRSGRLMSFNRTLGASFLELYKFVDITSSISVELIRPEQQVVTIYDGSYNGSFQTLPPGRYEADDVSIGAKALSSIRVPAGMRATLYEKGNCTGVAMTADRDRDFTGSRMFDNYYSSLVVEDVLDLNVTPAPEAPAPTPAKPDSVATPPADPPQPEANPCLLTDREYFTAIEAVRAKSFSQEKMEVARLATRDKCLTNEQVRGIARTFDFEEQTLEFVKISYENALEKTTYYTLEDVFKFMSSQEQFRQFMKSR